MGEMIADVLKRVIAKQLQLDPSEITPESVLSELGATSLDLVEIIMTVEEEYDVIISLDAVELWNNYRTFADLVGLGNSLGLERHRSGT